LVTTLVWAALGLSALAWGLASWPKDDKPLADSVAAPLAASSAVVQAADIAKVLGDSSAPAAQQRGQCTCGPAFEFAGRGHGRQGQCDCPHQRGRPSTQAFSCGRHRQRWLGFASRHTHPSAVRRGNKVPHLKHPRATQTAIKNGCFVLRCTCTSTEVCHV